MTVQKHVKLASHCPTDRGIRGSGEKSGPTVIKLFESENVLKCKNHLRDFIGTVFIFKHMRKLSKTLYNK